MQYQFNRSCTVLSIYTTVAVFWRVGSIGSFVPKDQARKLEVLGEIRRLIDGWNGRHMIALADAVRALHLPDERAVGGGAFVFADVLRAGPRATLAALLGVVLFGVVVVGRRRQVIATLASVANAGIRSFGAVAIPGEATCLLAALTLAPALLALMTPRGPRSVSKERHRPRLTSASAMPADVNQRNCDVQES